MIYNSHLEGDSFFWEGGPSGILLVHGLTATTAEVRPLARFLHELGYAVAGPLLPGHLTTPEDANRHKWTDWAETVETAYRRLSARCDRVVVGGESTGAVLALHLASAHPEVAAILAYAPALRLKMRRRDTVRLRVAALFRAQLPKSRFRDDPLWQGYTVYPSRGAIELLRLQRATQARLSAIRQPLFIAQGRLDETVDPRVPELLLEKTRSQIKVVHWMEYSAHCVILDRERERVAELTRQFLDRVLA